MTISSDFGSRVTYTQADLVDNQFSQQANSDGFVMAVIGTIGYEKQFLGMVAGTTRLNGAVTSAVYASATTQTVTNSIGKKGVQTLYLPMMGNFTMPVRDGETWTITLTGDAALYPVPNLIFYWIPDGEGSSQALSGTAEETVAAHQVLHQLVMAGKS